MLLYKFWFIYDGDLTNPYKNENSFIFGVNPYLFSNALSPFAYTSMLCFLTNDRICSVPQNRTSKLDRREGPAKTLTSIITRPQFQGNELVHGRAGKEPIVDIFLVTRLWTDPIRMFNIHLKSQKWSSQSFRLKERSRFMLIRLRTVHLFWSCS